MKKWYKIEAKATHTDVYIYDEIGYWGTSAERFLNLIKSITTDIVLHINSPGGQVFEGLAIYNMLKAHSSHVTTKIEGLAASMASIIALAGDTIEMAKNSMLMIHNPLIYVSGDSEELRSTAETLDKIKDLLVNVYSEKSNLSTDEISALMNEETWLSADEALAKGFITNITDAIPASNTYDPERFNNQQYTNWINNQKREGNMDKLLLALGVSTEAEAKVKIDALTTSNLALTSSNAKLTAKVTTLEAEKVTARINSAIAEGKITPAQKDFATQLINKDEALFNDFIAQAGNGKPNLTTTVDISTGAEGALTWEALLKDSAKMLALSESDPKLYEQLKNKYMEDKR